MKKNYRPRFFILTISSSLVVGFLFLKWFVPFITVQQETAAEVMFKEYSNLVNQGSEIKGTIVNWEPVFRETDVGHRVGSKLQSWVSVEIEYLDTSGKKNTFREKWEWQAGRKQDFIGKPVDLFLLESNQIVKVGSLHIPEITKLVLEKKGAAVRAS